MFFLQFFSLYSLFPLFGLQRNCQYALHGLCVQTLDANQDGTVLEACRLPGVLKRMHVFDPKSPRTYLRHAVVGFRETIYTMNDSLVGFLNATSEETFGSLTMRGLNALNIRLYYGHPDIFDEHWVTTHGGLSKASPNIHLSEDVTTGCYACKTRERG